MAHGKVAHAWDVSLREMAKPTSEGGWGPPRDVDGLVRCRLHPSDMPFAGKVVVWAGHWAQTLPIVQRGGRGEIRGACLDRQFFWKDVHQLPLTHNFRLGAGGPAGHYAVWLGRVADGSTTVENDTTLGPLPGGGGVLHLPKCLVMEAGPELPGWVYDGLEDTVEVQRAKMGMDSESMEGLVEYSYFDW